MYDRRWHSHMPALWGGIIILGMVFLLVACGENSTEAPTTEPLNTPITVLAPADQPVLLTGNFTYTNEIITDYFNQHAVALVDMYGFVHRDVEWEIPVESQTLGFLALDEEQQEGSYWLQLPARPTGLHVDVDQDENDDVGVQVFTVTYWPNVTGGPFSEGNDRSHGWPSYLSSTITDPDQDDEIIGGMLIVWSPDDAQQFPIGFGEDGLLFTEDDPIAPILPGYTVVNLDSKPFEFLRDSEAAVALYEPQDIAVKDFSDLSYTDAFDRMFEQVRKEYAFNGIPGKEPPWETLYEELMPRIERAEADEDATAFYHALNDFVNAFNDGHVYLSAGDLGFKSFFEQAGSGYGMGLRELDDGRVLVSFILEDGPAAAAGIDMGMEILEIDGQPVAEAIAEVVPLEGPYSTERAYRADQVRYLVRAPDDSRMSVTFRERANSAPKTVILSAEPEFESWLATSIFGDQRPDALPVEFAILDSGVGHIRINSNSDDLSLTIRLFERALRIAEAEEVPGLIIDMRRNGGGASLGLAGYLTDEKISLGSMEYYSEHTGQFESDSTPNYLEPHDQVYSFGSLALLVGPGCFSACEEEAYGFSQIPGIIVVGHEPTAGVYAEVARGQFLLPEDMSLQVSTGRAVLPDGSLFLEGTGVPPTKVVPVDEDAVFGEHDALLAAAEAAVLE